MTTNKIIKSQISTVKSVNETDFIIRAVVSTAEVDRYNEVIDIGAWSKGLDRYKQHPVLLSSHDYNGLTRQIGKALHIGIEGNSLVAEFKYFVGEGNPEADWAFNLASKGIAAFSVGFLPLETDNNSQIAKRVYKQVELIEISQVLVPANPEALQKQLLSEDPLTRELAEMVRKDFKGEKDNESVGPIKDIPCDLVQRLEAEIKTMKEDIDVWKKAINTKQSVTLNLLEEIKRFNLSLGVV